MVYFNQSFTNFWRVDKHDKQVIQIYYIIGFFGGAPLESPLEGYLKWQHFDQKLDTLRSKIRLVVEKLLKWIFLWCPLGVPMRPI